MRLLDSLRNAEQKSAKAVRRGMARAREEWGDLERRLRQRMRIYPQKLRLHTTTNEQLEMPETELEPGIATRSAAPEAPEAETRPIVTIHGKDVKEEEELNHPAA